MHDTRQNQALTYYHPLKVDLRVQHIASARMTRTLISSLSLCKAHVNFFALIPALIVFQIAQLSLWASLSAQSNAIASRLWYLERN